MSVTDHDTLWQVWQSALSSQRLHHAWLLAGPRGLGKGAFAQAAARALVGSDVGEGFQHADILTLTHLPKDEKAERLKADGKPFELKRNITIDQVRTMQRRLTTRPTLGDRRAVIVEPADDMERNAANALLKSLEEPPAGTYFFLVAHRPGSLLPTIRSRCRVLRFTSVSDSEIAARVAHNAPELSGTERDAIVAAAAGSPGMADRFIALDLASVHTVMAQLVTAGDEDGAKRAELAAAMGARPTRDRQLAAIDLARSVLARAMRTTPRDRAAAMADAYANLVTLGEQAPTYNFDPGILVMEIGNLLAAAAVDREAA